MNNNQYDKFLASYYLGERGMAIPIDGNPTNIHKLVSSDGEIPAEIPEELKEKHALFIKSGGILNEVSGFDSAGIANFVKQQAHEYLTKISRIIAETPVDEKYFSALSKIREILHNDLQTPFAMEINPLNDNQKDYSNRQKRIILDPNQEISREFSEIINKCQELENLTLPDEIITKIQEILGEYLEKTGAILAGIIFDGGHSLNVAKKEIPQLLKIYEKRMQRNKNLKNIAYSNISNFPHFSGENIGKLSMTHNKVGEAGIQSFVRSAFRGKNSEYFQKGDFRAAYGEVVKISEQSVVEHTLLAEKIASILETKSAETIQAISNNTNSMLI